MALEHHTGLEEVLLPREVRRGKGSRGSRCGARRDARATFRPPSLDNAPLFHFTPQLDAALPADPYEQLQLAHRIATHAFSAKASGLASEVARLRSALAARDERASGLEGRVAALRLDVRDAEDRARAHAEAASRLRADNESLGGELRRLRAEVARAEGLRRAMLRSLQPGATADDVDGGARAAAAAAACRTPEPVALASAAWTPEPPKAVPAPVPAPAPTTTSTAGPATDGKAFFRAARSRLDAAAFDGIMAAVRALNAGRLTRSGAAAEAGAVLKAAGAADLAAAFDALLAQHLPDDE
jgi:hypothetical protein